MEIKDMHRKPKVMLNPSSQYCNIIEDADGNELYNEGETMWDIAVRVKAALDEDGQVETYISRNARRQDSKLQEECDLAKKIGCDVFVSLHSDATADGTEGGGTWTFHADDEGRRLGETVQSNVLEAIRTIYPEVQFHGVREHWNRLYVLHNCGCPASLTEILFHSNPKEREMLKDTVFQELVAHACAKGILEYLGMRSE